MSGARVCVVHSLRSEKSESLDPTTTAFRGIVYGCVYAVSKESESQHQYESHSFPHKNTIEPLSAMWKQMCILHIYWLDVYLRQFMRYECIECRRLKRGQDAFGSIKREIEERERETITLYSSLSLSLCSQGEKPQILSPTLLPLLSSS